MILTLCKAVHEYQPYKEYNQMANTTSLDSGDKVAIIRQDANSVGERGALAADLLFNDVGVGYGVGGGGAVTQITSNVTAVELNTNSGQITTDAQDSIAAAEIAFTLTNSKIAATDVVVVSIATHTSAGTFIASVVAVAAGSCSIRLANIHASAAGDDVLVINFAVIKGSAS